MGEATVVMRAVREKKWKQTEKSAALNNTRVMLVS